MVRIFIGYGGREAESVAVKLCNFLKTETNMKVFLASPQSPDVPANNHDYLTQINSQLNACNFAIFVCHVTTPGSEKMIKEINMLISQKQTSKVLLFPDNDKSIPEEFKDLWHPVHFTPKKPKESFYRLTTRIYECYIISKTIKRPKITRENEEMPIQ